MEESTKTLAESLSIVKVQRVQLKRYLDMDHVMDALKSASTMLSDSLGSMLDPASGPVYGLDGLSAASALKAALADLERRHGLNDAMGSV